MRKRLPLVYVGNDSARKALFKRRSKGFFKKVKELNVICNVNACAIIYSEYDSCPDIWPPSSVVVRRILTKYKDAPEIERARRKTSQESYIIEKTAKAKEQERKLRKETREMEMMDVMNRCLELMVTPTSLPMADLKDLLSTIDSTIWVITRRIEVLQDINNAGQRAADRQVAPQPDEDDSFVAGDKINICNSVWPNSFCH